jgi:hypothetical protein
MKVSKSFCTNQWPPHPSKANENLRMDCDPIEIMMSDALPSHGVKPSWGSHKVKLRKVETW